MLKPYYGAANLSFTASQATLQLQYKKTLLYKDRFAVKTSGLDPLGVRPAEIGFPLLAISDPPLPIPNITFSHVSLDCEGLVLNADGSYVSTPQVSDHHLPFCRFWVSDEYGPYIYRFDAGGNLLQALQPNAAILPQIDGRLNFTSVSGPDTGRVGNQGSIYFSSSVSPELKSYLIQVSRVLHLMRRPTRSGLCYSRQQSKMVALALLHQDTRAFCPTT